MAPSGHKRHQKKQDNEAVMTGPRVRGKVWIEGEKGTFIGYGRVVLLQRIQEYGSISRAARSMKMSYRHAWELVDSMNRQGRTPLVETATGGKGGGGATITTEGENAIHAFWRVYNNFQRFLKKETANLDF